MTSTNMPTCPVCADLRAPEFAGAIEVGAQSERGGAKQVESICVYN